MYREGPTPEEAIGAKRPDNYRTRRAREPGQHLVGDDAPSRRDVVRFVGAGYPERGHATSWLERHRWNGQSPLEPSNVIPVSPVRVHLTDRKPVRVLIVRPYAVHTYVRDAEVTAKCARLMAHVLNPEEIIDAARSDHGVVVGDPHRASAAMWHHEVR